MGRRSKDITGKKFGKLTALYRLHNYHDNTMTYWLCVCDCGNFVEVRGARLRQGNTKSCGCLRVTHGLCDTRLYNVYDNMKQRCNNPNNKDYKNYGKRGIKICNEWENDKQNFFTWALNNGYNDTLTIDRIDNNKGYSPDNCRWVDRTYQNRNRRVNRNITINGKSHCLSEWCEILNLNYNTVWERIHKLQWTIEEALGLEVKP